MDASVGSRACAASPVKRYFALLAYSAKHRLRHQQTRSITSQKDATHQDGTARATPHKVHGIKKVHEENVSFPPKIVH